MDTYRAIVVDQGEDGQVQAALETCPERGLPDGDVLIRVSYSSLNYKDGLALTGKNKVIRSYPMVPGVDLVGTVLDSSSPEWKAGDGVISTGWGVGEWHPGGFAQLARLKAEWLVPLPQGLGPQEAMAIGTAGLTAMISVMELEGRGMKPGGRPIAVTGASGGVGSMAVAILAQRGYSVTASTGRKELEPYLRELGASDVIDRDVLAAPSRRPLESETWGGAIDSVGGDTLAGLFRAMAMGTSVAVCGLAGGSQLNTTVMPFFLRGVSLIGIDSLRTPIHIRKAAWEALAQDIPEETLRRMMQVVPLSEVIPLGPQILAGQVRGRTVVDVNAE